MATSSNVITTPNGIRYRFLAPRNVRQDGPVLVTGFRLMMGRVHVGYIYAETAQVAASIARDVTGDDAATAEPV